MLQPDDFPIFAYPVPVRRREEKLPNILQFMRDNDKIRIESEESSTEDAMKFILMALVSVGIASVISCSLASTDVTANFYVQLTYPNSISGNFVDIITNINTNINTNTGIYTNINTNISTNTNLETTEYELNSTVRPRVDWIVNNVVTNTQYFPITYYNSVCYLSTILTLDVTLSYPTVISKVYFFDSSSNVTYTSEAIFNFTNLSNQTQLAFTNVANPF
jgi:hypothetical protein